ncbi:MAG: GldG family protein [Thiohalomonadaceae bacterium]
MELNSNIKRRLRLQGYAFALLFLAAVGLVAWLSTRYHVQADWTASGRHTLAEASVSLLATLDDPITVTAFARESELTASRRAIADFVGRYQRHHPRMELRFVNPDLHPDKVRDYGVTMEGEMVIEYQERRENVQALSEEAFTNALQRLARSGERRIVFVQGHGERKPRGQANHDLGSFGRQLENKGFSIGTVNLAETPAIPDDTAALVIASPQVNLLPGEVTILRDYVAKGGNLLWFIEPGEWRGLEPVAALMGLGMHAGVVVDPTTQLLGIDNATFAVVADYPLHGATEGLDSLTLFPTAAALDVSAPEEWDVSPLLRTVARSWAEAGVLEGAVSFDEGRDVAGPLDVGVALARDLGEGETRRSQRVVVIGDGDFLSNAFIGNGANLDLGNRLVNWLSHDDAFINIPPRAAPDVTLAMTPALSIAMGAGFLLLIPGLLLGGGITLWLRRRRR